MGLFKKPPTAEELEKKARYEESKLRLMELHQNARIIYYIDEVLTDAPTQLPILIGELGKGELQDNLPMDIYSNEGIRVGSMIVEHQEEREERHFIPGRTIRTFCFPKEAWDGYIAGQMLVQMP